MRKLLSMDLVSQTPLLNGPFVSLSQSFRKGATVKALVDDGIFHPHMANLIPGDIRNVYGHQEQAIRAIDKGRTTLISTGTGSGKTECFLYPVISKALQLRDDGADPGISAVLVYPMNALIEDQIGRLRGLLAGSGITFGMYIGKTPEREGDVTGTRLKPGSSRADYQAKFNQYRAQGHPDVIHPPEEVCSREIMRTPGKQPRILLTNVKQLELLLTRGVDVELFDNARLDFLVFDEAHTFTGIQGAETAVLIRRLRTYVGKSATDTCCIATSATIVDEKDPDAAKKFASRFFGVPREHVETVKEDYEPEDWPKDRSTPSAPSGEIHDLLADTLKAVDAEDGDAPIRNVYKRLTGIELGDGDWREALFDALQHNEVAFRILHYLKNPREFHSVTHQLGGKFERPFTQEELVAYLALGAAATKEGRHVFRPVVHSFVRGIPGAVVSFPDGNEPELFLSSEDEIDERGGEDVMWRLPIHTCTTCGQHYLVTHLKDYSFVGDEPDGGHLDDDGNTYWEPLEQSNDGKRAILVDTILSQEPDDDLEDETRLFPLHFCRFCGAAHKEEGKRCAACGQEDELVKLFAVSTSKKSRGHLHRCVSCTAMGSDMGSRYREPARPVRAVNVSDVHILAQDMIHHAERKRLLLFADNRQDAAFQAGWMKDHARRFRLRQLMSEALQEEDLSVSDLVYKLNNRLDADDNLSRSLIPEVWNYVLKEGKAGKHDEERRYFLRIQVLREVTTAINQRYGLEPWGRMRVIYDGLSETAPFIRRWANVIGVPPADLLGGIIALLDGFRRQRVLYDPARQIFSRFMNDGAPEIQRGYLPEKIRLGGLKLQREATDDKRWVRAWVTGRQSVAKEMATKWGVEQQDQETFLSELWDYLTSLELGILRRTTLTGSRGNALPNTTDTHQIDASKLTLTSNHGFYRCKKCRRKQMVQTPHSRCMAWRCDGVVEFVREDPENYDLQILDSGYSMLRPEEHTAMVPQVQRDRIEGWFKGKQDRVNTLVCTPTLELGVDIGDLDAVLMRNVPPLPANFWQRAGRAGRRNRMAVNIAYCRPASHDRAYFKEPVKMLEGRVDPPAFNLRNEVLVGKHVHAATLTFLNKTAKTDPGDPETGLKTVMGQQFPRQIKTYLFDPEGRIRSQVYNTSPFESVVEQRRNDLVSYMQEVFQPGWPDEDSDVVSTDILATLIDKTPGELAVILKRLRKRLQWAHSEIARLNKVRDEFGTLPDDDEAHYRRCNALIRKMKGIRPKKRKEAEGYDDINTFGVLAAEGFLPGYGLDTGSVLGMAQVPFFQMNSLDFDLPRPTSVALREYVPGNLIYANGHKFVARRFHREADEERSEMPVFDVNLDREAVEESTTAVSGSLGDEQLRTMSVCDVTLVHQSQISDEEENRFQMPVAVYGREKGRHNGGVMYLWGEKQLSNRRGVHLRLVNVGSGPAIENKRMLGYPLCSVCGQSVSPLSSETQIESFLNNHEDRCGRKPENLGFFADIVADCLTLPEMSNRTDAYSVLETLRMAASHVLDMHLDDLQILVIGHIDRDEVDAVLWDPMPGGSGLFDQIRDRFKDVYDEALRILDECPSACDSSCIDCLQHFRNGYYHRHLDRHAAAEVFQEYGELLTEAHDIPPAIQGTDPHDPDASPVNYAENRLKHMLEAAGFTSGVFQQQVRFKEPLFVDHRIGSTTPDVFFAGDEDDPDDKGVCVYLDGMSRHIHGNKETAERDREIRGWLRQEGYQVIEIPYNELDDKKAMTRHFKRLAKFIEGKDMANRIAANEQWFQAKPD
ncbi:DEAD/DEAH box helicase [bacterium]|nr:DEAD/DEAH box helicase [bacterium]